MYLEPRLVLSHLKFTKKMGHVTSLSHAVALVNGAHSVLFQR